MYVGVFFYVSTFFVYVMLWRGVAVVCVRVRARATGTE